MAIWSRVASGLILPERSGLSRRGFLRACGLTALSVAVPSAVLRPPGYDGPFLVIHGWNGGMTLLEEPSWYRVPMMRGRASDFRLLPCAPAATCQIVPALPEVRMILV
jgi:hypothetical protein